MGNAIGGAYRTGAEIGSRNGLSGRYGVDVGGYVGGAEAKAGGRIYGSVRTSDEGMPAGGTAVDAAGAGPAPACHGLGSASYVNIPQASRPPQPFRPQTLRREAMADRAGMRAEPTLPAVNPELQFSWRQRAGMDQGVKAAQMKDIRGPVAGLVKPDPASIASQRCLIDPRVLNALIDSKQQNFRLGLPADAL